jgi:VanZ family protein
MAAIFAVSSIPDVKGIPGGFSDSTAHAAEYLVLAVLFLRALAGAEWRGVTWRTSIAAIALSVAYGLADEWHQSFVPGRVSEWRDAIADATGAFAGAGAVWAWSIIRHFSRSHERRHGVHEPRSRS